MEILTRHLPSVGWKSGLPESFDMRPFSGKELEFISEAIEKNSMAPILLHALPQVLSISTDMLTVQDAHALVLQQRFMIKDFPLIQHWVCHMPLFEHKSGVFQEPLEDEVPLNTFPCDAHNATEITEAAVTVLTLTANSDEFDLPRMINYEASQESRFNWFVAHMGTNFDQNYALLEQQEDMKLFMRLSAWVKAANHGIPSELEVSCPVCRRTSHRLWDMQPKIFDYA